MRNFILGIMVGVLLTAVVVQAGSKPTPAQEQAKYDYYRQRGAQLDTESIRKAVEAEQAQRLHKKPC